jgi:lipopolysaccharide biosynthesis regulator YciM
MQEANQGDFSGRLAHYLCEDAQALLTQGQQAEALQRLQQAIATAPQAARPLLEQAQLQHRMGQSVQALQTLETLAEQSPATLPLAANLLVDIANATGRQQRIHQLLDQQYTQAPSLDLLQALVALDAQMAAPGGGQDTQAPAPGRARLVQHLDREPSLVAAAQWLAGETLAEEQYHPAVQRALDHAAKPLTRYRCAACGFEARQHFWHCPGCQSWDSYPARRVEEL